LPRTRPNPIVMAAVLVGLLLAALASGSASAVGGFMEPYPIGSQIGDQTGLLRAVKAGALEPSEWLALQRTGEKGRIAPRAYSRALAQAQASERATAEADPALAAAEWSHMGPTNVGGRIVELAVDPTRSTEPAGSHVYAASASGGVWRSTTAGLTWERAWPDNVTQSMGALAINSEGVLFAGTGEANPGGGSIVYGGTGMYRSADGGETWEHVGLETAGAFGRIAVDPGDPNTIFAAAAGNLFVPGGERGLYRSTDGGTTWSQILAGDNDTTGAVDIAIDPADANNILAAMWDHHRLPTHRVYGGVGSGVYRSTDGGESWVRTELPHELDPAEIGRIGVAFAPNDPTRAYAVIANKLSGHAVGLFRSDDGGATWAATGTSPGSLSQSSYGWWFGKIWVDPADADRLFVAGLELVESTDAGESFTAQTVSTAGVATGVSFVNAHADQHAMVWDPSVAGRVYLGNDGGVYRSDQDGIVGSWIGGVEQGWTQHYSIDVSEQNPNRVVSGMQDNMCQRNYVGGNVGHPSTWTKYGLCGDGLQTLIAPHDDRLVYGCAQYGANCSRTEDGGAAFRFLGEFPGQRAGWWVPVVFDPSDPNVMYAGTNVVSRSTNGGLNWTAISDDLTTDSEQFDPNPGYRIYSTITTIAVAPSDPEVIYVGTDDGLLWRTTDGGLEWVQLSDGDEEHSIPGTWVTRLAVDPDDADVAYATFSSFRNGSDSPHVIRTSDGGATWENISGDLPSAPVNEIVVVEEQLIVGTDVGVFLSRDAGATWLTVGSNLPAVVINDLEYHAGTNTLTAATFGHGIQRVTLPG